MANVCVTGSINMDLMIETKRVPEQGETILGDRFSTAPGGKGANQAVAAARLGADVHMIGALGNDSFGNTLRSHLTQEGIQTDAIMEIADIPTGVANIVLSEKDNRIIVAPGANRGVTFEMIEQAEEKIKQSDVLLLQLEIPLTAIEKAVEIGRRHGKTIILNPAPYQNLPSELLEKVDYLTPNETEFHTLAAEMDVDKIKEKCIVTKGKAGVTYFSEGKWQVVPGVDVEVVDTTGAGDTFNGALAEQLAGGSDLHEAIHFANKAAAISVTKMGAQAGMPYHI